MPGRQLVGIEVPNGATGLVTLRDVIESESFQRLSQRARSRSGSARTSRARSSRPTWPAVPHLLIAGATGSGKSACVNSIIATLLLHATPDELRSCSSIDLKRGRSDPVTTAAAPAAAVS